MSSTGTENLISILILTRNEEIHIARCIKSARRLTDKIYMVDSNSSDHTRDIAGVEGVNILTGDFCIFSQKLNWSIENIAWSTPWVFRLDADEILTDELIDRLPKFLETLSASVTGVYVRRQLWFMGRWMRHGDVYPTYSMRLWRQGAAVCEERGLDEHMMLRFGTAVRLDLDIVDDPLFTLATWIEKHNAYSTLEAESANGALGDHNQLIKASLFGTSPQRRRWLKVKLFYRLPPFVRPMLYFFYRYVIRLGFLDGRVGFIFHFMHGLWYRCLVDAKMLEKYFDRSPRRQNSP